MEHADKLLMGDGAKTLGSARKTMASLECSSAQLASMLKSNQGALHNGLQGFNDLAPALQELRATLAAIRLIAPQLKDNPGDRKSAVSGKSGAVRVNLGGRRI